MTIFFKNTSKLDYLTKIESIINQEWNSNRIFEVDADETSESNPSKFNASLPCQYLVPHFMNQSHLFTIMKAEFAVQYERLKGKRSVLPFSISWSFDNVGLKQLLLLIFVRDGVNQLLVN